MRRRYGNPGRVDLAAIEAAPAEPAGWGYVKALGGFGAVMVILAGSVMLLAAVYRLAQHFALAALAHGG